MPNVIRKKKTTNSNGDFTGFLNLTIDKAPTIQRDRAMFPEITEVTILVTKGRIINVAS